MIRQLGRCFLWPHPFSFAGLGLWPVVMDICHRHRVDHDDHGRGDIADRFDVGICAKAEIDRLPSDASFLPGFGRSSLGRCFVVHRPALGQNPPARAARRDKANLDLLAFHAPAKRSELCADFGLMALLQLQGQLPGLATRDLAGCQRCWVPVLGLVACFSCAGDRGKSHLLLGKYYEVNCHVLLHSDAEALSRAG